MHRATGMWTWRYRESLAGAIYGTILATAVTAGLSEDPSLSPGEAAFTVLVTSLVFWLAHTYSEVLAGGLGAERSLTLRDLRRTAAQEATVLESAIVPVLPLVVGWLGLVHRKVAFNGAIVLGVVALFVVGFLLARKEGYGTVGTVMAGLLSPYSDW